MRIRRHLAVAIAVLSTTATLSAQAPPSRLPAAVSAAFTSAYPNARITGTSKETRNGKTVYEVESVDAGKARDLIYALDGAALVIEEEITAAEFPATATAALQARFPKARVTRYERVTEAAVVTYEAQLKGAAATEATFAADGTMLSPKPAIKK